ncbi:hypothetical protein [Curtobacterium flaccumfaciens]|uniref:hypothetical protein n=1 Tax=Curtobacterium flaccumfaciens TaxID=2035 RepID=UPI001BDE0E70|nr:hypothetical protein [Curtobacterium flaccumfaciens]MBT1633768.1 hypothetical protein [Curtobacterium flaccumfaciens pv. oortii]MCX2845572.1 hypothetical protein [Curtobacterium flaccumfaciens pv. oortii]
MPVPKSTTAKAAEPVEAEVEAPAEPDVALEADLPGELSYVQAEPHDFEVRRAALELAIAARENDPVVAARGYYGFLAGDKAEGTA